MKKTTLTLLLTTSIYASSAYMGDLNFTQKDGSTFKANMHGDEWFNWIEDKDEHIIKYNNKTHNFEYAELKSINGNLDLIPSGIKVGNTLRPTSTKIDKKILSKIWKQKRDMAYNFKTCK